MIRTVTQKGFTLIETLIYIGLFTIVIGGGLVATYQIIQSTSSSNNHIVIENEANFLLRKIDWALTAASDEQTPTPTTLNVTKSGYPLLKFDLNSGNLRLNTIVLNSSSVTVSNLSFIQTSGPQGVTVSFTLTTVQNGRTENFTTTKYIRK